MNETEFDEAVARGTEYFENEEGDDDSDESMESEEEKQEKARKSMEDLGITEDFAALTGSNVGDNFELN